MPWGSPLKLLGRMKYIIIAITIQAIAIIMKPPLGSPSPPEKGDEGYKKKLISLYLLH